MCSTFWRGKDLAIKFAPVLEPIDPFDLWASKQLESHGDVSYPPGENELAIV